MFRIVSALVVVLSAALAATASTDDGRYDVILSRKPFGTPPAPPPRPAAPAPVAPPPTPAEVNFAKTLRVAYMRRTAYDELRVGIIDSQTQKSYLLAEGQQDEDGLELRQVDFEKNTVLVARGAVESWITAGNVSPAPASPIPGSPAVVPGATGTQSPEYAEILRRRQEEMRRRAELMRRH